MVLTQLISQIKKLDDFYEFQNIHIEYIQYILASQDRLFGISYMQSEEVLKSNWLDVSQSFALNVQSLLNDTLYEFKWDMYLVFVLNAGVSEDLQKKIENDRRFFKKIVISLENNETLMNTIALTIESNKDEVHSVGTSDFVKVLENVVEEATRSSIDIKKLEEQELEIFNEITFLRKYEDYVK